MKKSKMKSMLSKAMVLVLMLSIIQVAVGGFDVNAQDPFINYDAQVGTGEYQGISINKTVTDYVDGKFNVKIEVDAAEEPLQANLDVALLIDKSGSMAGDRIVKAKEAAKKFVDRLIVPGKDNIQLAVISFSREATVDIGLSTDVAAIKEKIDNISASGATFADLGLASAYYELANNGRPDAQKLIVFIADGIPTIAWEREEIPIEKELQFEPYYTSWHLWSEKYWKRGYNGIKEINVKVSNQADVSNQIGDGSYFGDIGRVARNSIITADGYKKKGMEIISLGLGMVSERERYFMKEVSSSGNYYNTDENLDDLDKILSKINEDIITYKVRNGVIVDEEDFPARVKYGNLSEVQIKVINSATGTEENHTIKKSWVEDFSQFHFSGIYLKPGQKLIITYPAELLPKYRDGGMWRVGSEDSYFKLNANVKEEMKLPTPLVSGVLSGSVTVTKTWSEEPDRNIQEIDVMVTGKVMDNPFYEGTLKVKKVGAQWRGTLEGLTVYHNGNKVAYEIKEVEIDGYQAKYTPPVEEENGKYVFQIHNQKVATTPSDDLTVKVKKSWLGEMPNQLELELYQNNTKIDSLIMKKPSNNRSVWDGKFANKVKRQDASGVPYEYKIIEKMTDANYSADNSEVILKEMAGGILFGAFTNRNIARVNIPVEKKWTNTPDAEQMPVKVFLYRTTDVAQAPVKVEIEPLILNERNGYKSVFDSMPLFDSLGDNATGKRFLYSVKEDADTNRFDVAISGEGTDEKPFVITNSKKQAAPIITPYLPPYIPEESIEENEVPKGNGKDENKEKDTQKEKDKETDKTKTKLLSGTDSPESRPKDLSEETGTGNKEIEKPKDKDTVIEHPVVPEGKPQLPKTGGIPAGFIGLMGVGLIGLGVQLKRKDK